MFLRVCLLARSIACVFVSTLCDDKAFHGDFGVCQPRSQGSQHVRLYTQHHTTAHHLHITLQLGTMGMQFQHSSQGSHQ